MTEHMLFPFDTIEKDSRIVIYGAGDMGGKILKFIRKTKFCEVICFLDRNYECKEDFPFTVMPPEAIAEIKDYAFVLVSMLLEDAAKESKIALMKLGVPEEKILFLNENHAVELPRFAIARPKYVEDADEFPLTLAFVLSGGLGDELIASLLLKEIRKTVPAGVGIDCYSAYSGIFSLMPFIDNVFPLSGYSDENSYDAVFNIRRFVSFEKVNLAKIERFSKLLHDFCINSIDICARVSGWVFNDKSYTDYCLIQGKNRLEQANPHGILPYDRCSPVFLKWDAASFEKLNEWGLPDKKYILLCNNAGEKSAANSNKLWPAAYFDELIAMLRILRPDLLFVWVGATRRFGAITNADIDLIGKTSLSDMCVLLKHSVLAVGIEGGLTHLQHFLNGRSACLFGSTDIRVYGYAENINIKSGIPKECDNGCEWVTSCWLDGGCLIAEEPVCMATLSPRAAYDAIAPALLDIPSYECVVENIVSGGGSDRPDRHLRSILRHANSVALIGREGDDLLFGLEGRTGSATVFSENMTMPPEENAGGGNCLYIEHAGKQGIVAEYGWIHNIPSGNGSFDAVLNCTLTNAEYPEFAMREMLRILADDGRLILRLQDFAEENSKWRRVFSQCGIMLDAAEGVEDAIFITIRKHAAKER